MTLSKKKGAVLARRITNLIDKVDVTIFLLLQEKLRTKRNFNSHVTSSKKNPKVHRCRTWKVRIEMLNYHEPMPEKQLDYKLPGICNK
jgi:hypothetical protein